MPTNELESFVDTWDREAENTLKLLRGLPAAKYDFRPDPPVGRSASWPGTWPKATPTSATELTEGSSPSTLNRRTSSGHVRLKGWRRGTSAFTGKPLRGSAH